MEKLKLHTADYIVMAIFLLISAAIGFYYGMVKKQHTTLDYILGGRKMHLLPVAISLAVTYQSAVSILGLGAEIYMYHTMAVYSDIGLILATIVQAFVIVPLIHPLKLTSAYEYLFKRFQSRSVQLLATVMGMIQTGGLKAVVWTDVFQFVIMYGGIIVLLVMGGISIGSFTYVFELADEGHRIKFDEISVDPRVRHTVWGCIISGLFNTLPNCLSQSAVQRISSIHLMKDAKRCTMLNIPIATVFLLIVYTTALLVFSYFAKYQCDPILDGSIDNPNQLIPYYVMHVLNHAPGLAGIFMAAIFSASLSSLSSGISSLTANTIQDLLEPFIKSWTQTKTTALAKIIAFGYGTITVLLAYFMKNIHGPVTQMATTAFGSAGGPVVGIFFLGAMFPQANWLGALIGGLVGIVINVWIALGMITYGAAAPKSQPISTAGCEHDIVYGINSTMTVTSLAYTDVFNNDQLTSTTATSGEVAHLALYDVSYVYTGLIGLLITLIVGITVSLITGKFSNHKTDAEFLFPFVRPLWGMKVSKDDEEKKIKEENTKHEEMQNTLERISTKL